MYVHTDKYICTSMGKEAYLLENKLANDSSLECKKEWYRLKHLHKQKKVSSSTKGRYGAIMQTDTEYKCLLQQNCQLSFQQHSDSKHSSINGELETQSKTPHWNTAGMMSSLGLVSSYEYVQVGPTTARRVPVHWTLKTPKDEMGPRDED